jgi:hypothetical protein
MPQADFDWRLLMKSWIILSLLGAVLLLPACSDAAGPAGGAAARGERAAAGGEGPDGPTAAWGRALERYALDGGVDYGGLREDPRDLEAFLLHVARTAPSSLPEAERLALLVNAYNAYVVKAVLDRYPGIRSVRNVDGFFDEQSFRVGGEYRTLDEIETAAREIDERVHFAVVCASTSCPDLRAEAYTGGRIDAQLEEQTERFLADPEKGLRYDAGSNDLYLSSIFKWYAGDFTGGSTVVAFFARGGILDWIVEHLGDRELAETLAQRQPSIKYMDYDWSLNDR